MGPDRCVITGVSTEPARGPSSADGLYQFWTDREEPVRLHDTDLVSVSWEACPRPVLTTRFVYEPGWVPVEVTGRAVVEFVFGDAVVREWSTIDESEATRPSGEVDLFDWDGNRAPSRCGPAVLQSTFRRARCTFGRSRRPDGALSPASGRRRRGER